MELEKYSKLSVAVDIIVFTIQNDELKVLLVKRKFPPFKGKWAIPGGFVREKENLEESAKRELEEETGVAGEYLEQLYTFGDIGRDPRGRVISVSYFALINSEKVKLRPETDVSDAGWFSINPLPELAFDHDKILKYALKRLRWKFEYTTIGFSMLPNKFTMSQLQGLYETIFNKKFDKRNFRKKVLSLDILETEEIKRNVSHRPPQLYSLKTKIGKIVEII